MKGLPHTSAFVVQLRSSAEPGADRSGRVEHVASGQVAMFQSVKQLPQLLLEMLKNVASDEEN